MTSILYSDVFFIKELDGDTVQLNFNTLIGRNFYNGPCRLAGINAPEMKDKNGKENPAGIAAKEALAPWLKLPLKIEATHGDKYQRPLIMLYAKKTIKKVVTWVNVNQWMLDNGFAVKMGASKLIVKTEANILTLPLPIQAQIAMGVPHHELDLNYTMSA